MAEGRARAGVKFSDAMECSRVFFCGNIPPALLGQHMDHHRPAPVPCNAQHGEQFRQIVAVHRAKIRKAHVFKNRFGDEHSLHGILDVPGQVINALSAGNFLQNPGITLLHAQVFLRGAQALQMPGQAAHTAVDGHGIVVQHYNQRLPADGSVVQGLVDHAAGGCAVAQQGHHVIMLPQQCSGPGHA